MIHLFIGYDDRETVAYHVCVNSVIRRSSELIAITPLYLKSLQSYKETHLDGSNQFIYSRFLVPFLMGFSGWAIYIDGDMILRDDIVNLWALRDESKAVLCVKHQYQSKVNKKYLGAPNENYPRKNWSSVILWNCGHPSNKCLTPELIENSTGAFLHRFSWLQDHLIGEVPIEWNWLPDEFGENHEAKLLHWTLGTPCFNECRDTPMSQEWHAERELVNFSRQIDD